MLLAATGVVRSRLRRKSPENGVFRLIRTPTIPSISLCSYIEIGDLCIRRATLTDHAAACVFVAMGYAKAMLFERGGVS